MRNPFKKNPDTSAIDPANLSDDVETLREQQRLLQMASMDNWVNKTVKQQHKGQRARTAFRFALLGVVTLSIANTAFIYHSDFRPGSSSVDYRHVGLLDVTGPIAANTKASSDAILAGVRRALKNEEQMEALVLRINSPGGSPSESQRVFHELRKLRELHPDTPIVSWIGDVGASGAYYIASATEEIHSAPSSLVGSIGVISSGFGFTEAMEEWGIERRVYTAGENKAFMDAFSTQTPQQVMAWESVLESTHQQFVNDVQLGRNGKLDAYDMSDEVFSGMVWTGEQALDVGLVDSNITLDDLYRSLLPQEDGSRPRVISYSPKESPFERFSKSLIPGVMSAFGVEATPGVRYQLD
nr:S49 family peptidase [uncultured Halomonas sp.]